MSNYNHKIGNILSVEKGIIIHQCNAQGVMGAGLAKQIAAKYPQHLVDYKEHLYWCKENDVNPMGQVVYTIINDDLIIAGIIGQRYYGAGLQTDYNSLQKGLKSIIQFADDFDDHLHYPQIGCGHAGGDWAIVRPMIDKIFKNHTHTYWTLK